MATRRKLMGAMLAALGALAILACNVLIGAPDRVLDEGDDVGPPSNGRDTGKAEPADTLEPDNPSDGGTPDGDLDGGSDAPDDVRITVGTDWETPNGATWVVDGGTTITGFTATHPVLVPKTQPDIGSDDYTVLATVLAPSDGEFGILTRVQPDGSAVVLASKYGSESKPFMGSFGPPMWNPSNDGQGPLYTFVTNTRYKFKLHALGTQVGGKMWDSTQPEPASYQVVITSPWPIGRGVGFYTYGLNGAVLESLQITVP